MVVMAVGAVTLRRADKAGIAAGVPGLDVGREIGAFELVRGVEPPPTEFGVVLTETTTRFTLELVNPTGSAIEVLSTNTSCGCTTVNLSDSVIEPGKAARLVVDYTADAVPEFVTTTATLALLSDGARWDQPVVLAGEVAPLVVFEQGDEWIGLPTPVDLGVFPIGTPVVSRVRRGDRAPRWESLAAQGPDGAGLETRVSEEGTWEIAVPDSHPEYSGVRFTPITIRVRPVSQGPEFVIRRVMQYEVEGRLEATPVSVYAGTLAPGTEAVIRLEIARTQPGGPGEQGRDDFVISASLASIPGVPLVCEAEGQEGQISLAVRVPVPEQAGSILDALLISEGESRVRVPIRMLVRD